MYIETDRQLVQDPCWSAIGKVIFALRENPALLREKKPEWEDGLNMITVNGLVRKHRLSQHVVFEKRTIGTEPDLVEQRWLDVYHPDLDDPIQVCTWSRISGWERPSTAKMERIEAYLRAWQEERAEQITQESPESRAVTRIQDALCSDGSISNTALAEIFEVQVDTLNRNLSDSGVVSRGKGCRGEVRLSRSDLKKLHRWHANERRTRSRAFKILDLIFRLSAKQPKSEPN